MTSLLLSWSEDVIPGGRNPDPIKVSLIPPAVPPRVGVMEASLGVRVSVNTKLSLEVAEIPLCSSVRLQGRVEFEECWELLGERIQLIVDRVDVVTEHRVPHTVMLMSSELPSRTIVGKPCPLAVSSIPPPKPPDLGEKSSTLKLYIISSPLSVSALAYPNRSTITNTRYLPAGFVGSVQVISVSLDDITIHSSRAWTPAKLSIDVTICTCGCVPNLDPAMVMSSLPTVFCTLRLDIAGVDVGLYMNRGGAEAGKPLTVTLKSAVTSAFGDVLEPVTHTISE